MADPAAVQPTSHVLIETLLDWPVLLFVLLVVLFFRGRDQIMELLRDRKVEVSLGGNTISIGDAVQSLDMETKQALEDFRKNQADIAALQDSMAEVQAAMTKSAPKSRSKASKEVPKEATKEAPGEAAPPPPPSPEPAPAAGKSRRPGSYQRMLQSITDSSFEWRSLERLAIEARISESEARAILAEHSDQIVLGKDRTGKPLARLKRAGDG